MKLRLPFLELAAASFEGTDESPKSWVQCAKVGSFFSKRYKKFNITEEQFDEMIKNLSANESLVDYDHLSTAPISERPSPDAGKAAGWILALQKRNSGRELWALVEWTRNAAELIRNKEYRFISPTIVPSFPDSENEGKSLGAKLIAMALTNLPFLRMAPVSLSADEPDMLQLAEVSLDERMSRISQAFYDRFNASFDMGAYIVAYFDDYVIARRDGKLWKISIDVDDKLNVSFGEANEVVVQYQELSSQGEQKMSEKQAPSTEVVQLQSDLVAQNQKIVELSSRLDSLQTENSDLKKKLARTDAEKKVDVLVGEGRLLPKQREWAVSYALSDNAGFDAFAATLEKQVVLNKEHGHGQGGTRKDIDDDEVAQSSNDKVIKEFSTKISDLIKNEKLSWSEAMRKAQEQEPELALSYLEAMRADTDVQ